MLTETSFQHFAESSDTIVSSKQHFEEARERTDLLNKIM